MASRSFAEVATGAVVIVLAGVFLAYAVAHTGVAAGGYPLTARFNDITGLGLGADVRIGGVKVGSVTAERLDPATYQAVVTFTVANDVKVPKDSSAVVATEGLLGGNYLDVQPGGDTAMLAPGGRIMATQSAINLQSLLGKFIFNGASHAGAGQAGAGQAGAAKPAGPGP